MYILGLTIAASSVMPTLDLTGDVDKFSGGKFILSLFAIVTIELLIDEDEGVTTFAEETLEPLALFKWLDSLVLLAIELVAFKSFELFAFDIVKTPPPPPPPGADEAC